MLAEVKAADLLVIALPVYNFGVPSQLKSWIDQLARKGETFNYSETGPVGLLTGKRAIVAFTSDGTKMGSEIDFASGYVRHMLGFFGITDVQFAAADAMAYGRTLRLPRVKRKWTLWRPEVLGTVGRAGWGFTPPDPVEYFCQDEANFS